MADLNLNDEGKVIMSNEERAVILGMDDRRMAACFEIVRVITKGRIVKIKSSIVIPHFIFNYDEYTLMSQADKSLL